MASRRDVLKAGGLVLLGGAVGGCATATGIKPAVPLAAKLIQDPQQTEPTPASAGSTLPPGVAPEDKPTYVAQTRDPIAYSLAGNLFWNDIMMEHAMFFTMLMPGLELNEPRRQALEFQRLFAQQLEQSPGINTENYVAFNRRSIDLAKRFSDYKKTMQDHQARAKVRSLVWPLFFQHTAREADRFAARLDLYNRRQIEFDRGEVVDFWSKTMGEHSGFIAHLLDPDERLLISQASRLEKAFLREEFRDVGGDVVMKAAQEILDFKTVSEKGIRFARVVLAGLAAGYVMAIAGLWYLVRVEGGAHGSSAFTGARWSR